MRFLKMMILTVGLLLFIPCSSSAEEELFYDGISGEISISGCFEQEMFNKYVSIMVSAKGDSTFSPVYVDTIYVDKKGYYFHKFYLPDDTVSGDYVLRIGTYELSKPIEYPLDFYVSVEDRTRYLVELNHAEDFASFVVQMRQSIHAFGLMPKSTSLPDNTWNAIYKEVYEKRPFDNLFSWRDIYYHSVAPHALDEAKIDEINNVLKEYERIFDFKSQECYELYESFGEDRAQANLLFYNKDVSTLQKVYEEFNRNVLLYAISTAYSPGNIKELIDRYKHLITFDLYLYNTNKDKAVNKIHGGTYTSMEELEQAIKAALSGDSGSNTGGNGPASSKIGKEKSTIHVTPNAVPDVTTIVPNNTSLKQFNDMMGYEWALEAVSYLAEKNVIVGDPNGNFAPNRNVTREEFVKMAVVAFGLYDENAGCLFDDVSVEHWAYKYIASAVQKGVLKGVGENRFGTGQPISREDIAVILVRIAEAKGFIVESAEPEFADVDNISAYAREAVGKLKAQGIIHGYGDNTFRGKANATRAEAAQIIFGLMKEVSRQ